MTVPADVLAKVKGKRVLSMIKPTGSMTIGNYLGAIQNFVDLQNAGVDAFLAVADLHALTVPHDPDELRELTQEIIMVYMACGLDPGKSTLFIQSHIPPHAELGWVMNCLSYMGELGRMTQFKDKAEGKEAVGAGLFTYPCLMAADIVLYDADYVPVGEDQKQHVELTRDLAIRFNYRYGETLKVPEPLIQEVGARIMGLDNPLKKMSKTAESEYNYILMLEPPDSIRKKFSRAVTDSEREIRYDWENKPGVSNLLEILSLFGGTPIPMLEEQYRGAGYGQLKKDVAEAVISVLEPIQARYRELDANRDQVAKILRSGAERAAAIAEATWARARQRLGLYTI